MSAPRDLPAPQKLPSHEERLNAARAVAGYEIGDRSWADVIVAAYCDPEAAAARLAEERS